MLSKNSKFKPKKSGQNKVVKAKPFQLLSWLRFHTTFHLHMKAHKNSWYREWHEWRFSHHFHVAMLVFYTASVLLGSLVAFFPGNSALAANKNWNFDESPPENYYGYNQSKISVSGGQATLRNHTPGGDWIAADGGFNWSYRKAFTITNPNGSSDFQVQLAGVDTVLGGKMQASCADLRFTSDDGVTVIPHWVESATCPSASTTIWVKVPAGKTTVYMYYGNTKPDLAYEMSDSVNNWFRASSSADGTKLAAVVYGGQIYTSTDSGATWTPRDSVRLWNSVASSADGTKLAATVSGGQLYTSTDSGATWTPRDSVRNWNSVASSADGTKLAAVVYGGQLYTSTDSGATWTPRDSVRDWIIAASSADGTKLVATVINGQIYTSTDSGATWTPRDSNRNWVGVTSSADGTKLAAVVHGGQIYTSTDSGATWTPRDSNRNWVGVTSSSDGTKLVATVSGGQLYTSTDSGATWTPRDSNRNWVGVTSSSDGTKLAATVSGGQIYTSTDSGATWTAINGRDIDTFEKVIGNVQGAWQMNETSGGVAADSSGNGTGYNGARTPSGAVPYANGKFGYATDFSGGGHVEIADNTAPKLDITNNLSISAWIYTTMSNDYQVIVNKGPSNTVPNNYRFRINNDNKLRFSWDHGDGAWHTYGANTNITPNVWHHVSVTYSNPNGTFYLDGSSDGTFSDSSGPMASDRNLWIGNAEDWANPFLGYIDELKIYDNTVLTQADITALADPTNQNHASYFSPTLHPNIEYVVENTPNVSTSIGSEAGYYYNDNPTIQNQESSNGVSYSYISAMSITTGGTGSVRFQISPDNGTTWYRWNGSAWATVSSPDTYAENKTSPASDVTTNIGSFRANASNPGSFRWRAFLVSDGSQTATIDDISITYMVDTTAPANPVIGGVTAYESDGGATWAYNPAQLWHNYSAPKFTWTPPSDTGNPDASGVWRYYAKRDTDSGYTPTSADATTSPYLIASSLTNGQTYYLRIRTEDNAENVSSAATLLTYKYDNAASSDPSNLQANTLQPTDQPLSFSWDASTDPIPGGGEASGLDHYEYKVGSISDWQSTTETSVSGIVGDEDGNNTFRVRAVDVAGNISGEDTIVYNYILDAPSEPTNLTVTDQSKNANDFEFSWSPPSYVKPGNSIAGYKVFVNELPSANPKNDYSYIHSTNKNNIGNVLTKSGIRATQQGVNRFYIVAYDDNNPTKINYSKYAWKDFQVDTTATAPTTPRNVAISDVSDRNTPEHFAIALSWKNPINYSASTFGHYNIRRSTTEGLTDGAWLALTPVGTATSNAFAESLAVGNITYYYRVSGVDNAGAEVTLSPVVSKIPTGKYIQAPAVNSGPSVTATATSAIVSWVTDRQCYSKVEYGKAPNSEMQNSSLQGVTAHSIALYGLEPGTTYYYRVQSLDSGDQKDYSDSTAYTPVSGYLTFQTQPAPGISDVKISDIRLDSAIITWKTTSSATSTLKYGKTNSYGKEVSDSSGSSVTTHTVKLSGLDHSSTYHFKIFGSDTDGNIMQSDDYNFDTLTFPKITNVKYQQVKGTATSTLKVTWDSNVPVSSTVQYTDSSGKTQESSQSQLVMKHEMTVSGLKDNTEYTFVVTGRDAYGNEGSAESQKVKTDFDTRPPDISEITTETSISGYGASAKSQMIVSWYTDEPATSQVEYAKGVSGDSYTMATKEDTNLTTSHVVVVSDLDPSSSYYFRVVSKDNSKNEAKSEANSALTEQARSSIFDIVLKSFESTLGWLFGGGLR